VLTRKKLRDIEIELELRKRVQAEIKKRWKPLPGPQTAAYNSKADNLFYGGAAGGGKTDLLLGLSLNKHENAILFRREYPQLKGIIERSTKIYEGIGTYNKTGKIWRIDNGATVELGSMARVGDEKKYQGRPHDLIGADELTHFTKAQIDFVMGWLRSSNKHQRKRFVGTGNPPTDVSGLWVKQAYAPWLDRKHPKPAKPGELRYFTTINDRDTEVDEQKPFKHNGILLEPRSRTFIPARIEDNPYLMESGYRAVLQALPKEIRSKLLEGNFDDEIGDEAWQIIPTDWVLAAQQRWRERQPPDLPIHALGIDVARGGKDKTIIFPRRGNWFDMPITYAGTNTPDSQHVATLVLKHKTPGSFLNVDVIGVGSGVYDILHDTFEDTTFAFNGAEGTDETDESGLLSFINCRALWWWRFREALDPINGQELAIPDDPEILADICAPNWKMGIRGIQVEDKEKIKKRIGRSPDYGDAIVYAFNIKENWLPSIEEIDNE
jgi:hypothetical protein